MIPPLNEHGYLPPGAHLATLDEVIARFGSGNEVREAQAQSLTWLLELCHRAPIARLIINGSFVTDVVEPNDVDCVALQAPGYNDQSAVAAEFERGFPFLSLQVVRQDAFEYLANSFYATDRASLVKGVVEVVL